MPVSANEFQDAVRAHAKKVSDCVYKNIDILDDGISGADVVARAVVAACGPVLDRASEVMIYGTGPHTNDVPMLEEEREKMRQRVENDATNRAALAVLKRRSAGRR